MTKRKPTRTAQAMRLLRARRAKLEGQHLLVLVSASKALDKVAASLSELVTEVRIRNTMGR